MSRLSLELTPEQHQRLKAMAALSGKTMKDNILARATILPRRRMLCQKKKPCTSWKLFATAH